MNNGRWEKDPDAVLDYTVDWSAWLEAGDTIASHSVAVEAGGPIPADPEADPPTDEIPGIVIDSTTADDTAVTAWISSGRDDTDPARVRYRITTAGGRTDDRTILLYVRQR